MWRIVVAVGLVLGMAVVATPQPAFACSCMIMDADRFLGTYDAAFIGTVLSSDVESADDDAVWTFEVEQVVKGELGETVEVLSHAQSSMCGFALSVGERTGVFMNERNGQWHSSTCSQIEPEALLAATPTIPDDAQPSPQGAAGDDGRSWWLVLGLLAVAVAGGGWGLIRLRKAPNR